VLGVCLFIFDGFLLPDRVRLLRMHVTLAGAFFQTSWTQKQREMFRLLCASFLEEFRATVRG